jgi:hypothetical protein
MMGQIYRNVEEVYMWLGPAEHENEMIFGRMNENWDIENDETFEDQLELLCRRPYFSRQWIVQEVLLARRATVFCGSQFIGWHELQLYIAYQMGGLDRAGGKFAFELAWKSSVLLKMGTGSPLLNLLINGRLYCHDFRDRIFSFVSIASDCVGLEEVIVDYEAEMWELFFGLLEIFRPRPLVSFACALHNVLEVPSAVLIEHFNSGRTEIKTVTDLQRLSQVFKWNVKDQTILHYENAKDFDDLFEEIFDENTFHEEKLSDAQFYPICASLSENFGTLTTNKYECRVGNANLHLRFRATIFGYVLKDVLEFNVVDFDVLERELKGDRIDHWGRPGFMVTGLQSIIRRQRFCSKLKRVYDRLLCANQVSNIASSFPITRSPIRCL